MHALRCVISTCLCQPETEINIRWIDRIFMNVSKTVAHFLVSYDTKIEFLFPGLDAAMVFAWKKRQKSVT